MDKNITLHGVFLNISNVGTLLIGKSGVGKSELALSLVEKRHQLVGDDAITFTKMGKKIIGNVPRSFRNFLMIRGLGIINVVALFGKKATKEKKTLQLIIELKKSNPKKNSVEKPQLESHYNEKSILGIMIPHLILTFTSQHNLPLLIEIIVKNYLLKVTSNYDAYRDFEKMQRKQLGKSTS